MNLDSFFTAGTQSLDFDALLDAFDWARAMADTPQDPRYHGEGDVWTHTRMVCEAMTRDGDWTQLGSTERRTLLIAGLLHDVGKPRVTFTDSDGRIRSPEHALRGETIARRVLWELGAPRPLREEVAALVRDHMQPRYLPEQKNPHRRVFAISWLTRCDHLALLARADTRGRIAPDYGTSLARTGEFVEFCRRHDCLAKPRAFTTDHARFLFFRHRLEDPAAVVEPPGGPIMTIMSGLPGSGKDSWIREHGAGRPVVSLDDIRVELGVHPGDRKQEPVVQLARERAARLLAEGEDFIWNATTLSRRHRRTLLDFAAAWDPRVHMVHVEAPPATLRERNRERTGVAAVPEDVIERMTHIWQPPTALEAHEVTHVVHGGPEPEGAAPSRASARPAHRHPSR